MSEQKFFENNSNNMETQKLQQEVLTTTPDASKDLAEEVLRAQKSDAELQAALVNEKDVPEQLDAARAAIKKPETETKRNEAEHKAIRMEFANKILQIVSDHLQEKIDKKGIAGFFTPKFMKVEMSQGIAGLKIMQGQKLDRLNLPALFAEGKPGVLADKNIQKEIYAMVKTELDPEDQKMFEDQKNLVGHQMTNVSAG